MCLDGLARAESRYATPAGLLAAIAMVESGRELWPGRAVPWPWTVTSQGQSLYFDTKDQAVAWVRQAQAHGEGSIDVGCMQVNLHYHPTAFETISDAFDPGENADYAARFLRSLCGGSGGWSEAVADYHSHTLTLGPPYRRRVESRLAQRPISLPALADVSPLQQIRAAWASTLRAADRPEVVVIGFRPTPPRTRSAPPSPACAPLWGGGSAARIAADE